MINFTISRNAFYLALLLLASFIPYVGYLQFGPIAFTTIPPLVALACMHLGFWGAFTAAATFGFSSFFLALNGSASILFVRFEIAVLARIMLGFLVYFAARLISDRWKYKFVALALISTLGNTMLVTAFMFMVALYDTTIASIASNFVAWVLLIWVNVLVELGVAVVLGLTLNKLTIMLRDNAKNLVKISW